MKIGHGLLHLGSSHDHSHFAGSVQALALGSPPITYSKSALTSPPNHKSHHRPCTICCNVEQNAEFSQLKQRCRSRNTRGQEGHPLDTTGRANHVLMIIKKDNMSIGKLIASCAHECIAINQIERVAKINFNRASLGSKRPSNFNTSWKFLFVTSSPSDGNPSRTMVGCVLRRRS